MIRIVSDLRGITKVWIKIKITIFKEELPNYLFPKIAVDIF